MKITQQGEKPFHYWVFKDALDARLAQMICGELVDYGNDPEYRSHMYKYDNVFEKKLAQDNLEMLPPTTKSWLVWTLTAHFVSMIESITGVSGLIPDPWFTGAGFHLHTTGGVLKPHIDFSRHRKHGLIRRFNYIVYFNKNYEKTWGGELELWDKEMKSPDVKIEPGYNVGVLFETPDAPHGFSVPWNAPNGITRKSLAVYLYSAPTLEDLQRDHKSTQFLRAKGETTNDETEALRERRNHGRI